MAKRQEAELYDLNPFQTAVRWVTHTGLGRAALVATALTVAAAATLPSVMPRSRPEINIPSISRPADSSQSTGQTVVDTYYSQARSAILQDVPGLADPQYKSALDYTAQRMVDMKNVYGLSLDQIRAPMAKWVQANVDWDRKGERLVPLSAGTDFIPLNLPTENTTYDPVTRQKNLDMATPERLKNAGASKKIPYAQMLAANIDSIIAGHDQIWADIHDPEKMENYLLAANAVTYVPYENRYMEKHKKAILEHGTFEDRAHYALIGKAVMRPIRGSNEELTRNEVPLAMILSVGGDARIETNHQSWDVSAYKGTSKIRPDQGDRQLAFRKSKQLRNYLDSNPQTYGTPLDPDYIEPALPSLEVIDALKGYVSPNTGVRLIEIKSVTLTNSMGNGKIYPR